MQEYIHSDNMAQTNQQTLPLETSTEIQPCQESGNYYLIIIIPIIIIIKVMFEAIYEI